MEIIKPHAKLIRLFFFWAGVIATLSYRIIIVLNYYSPLWVKVAWYIGTIGFILYFGHRYNIQKKRSQLVEDYNLVDVVDKTPCVDEKQREALKYIVKTSLTSKSRWNSGFIFILSVVALVIGIVIDIVQIL